MAELSLVDVSIRDGNQSIWSANGLDTRQILQIAPTMERVGYRALDYMSSTAMGVAVRVHGEDPWERIRLTRKAMPTTKLQLIGTGLRFISWDQAHPDFMQLMYDRMVANGIDRFVVLEPTLDLPTLLETARMIRKAGGSEIIVALTYSISEIHNDAFYGDLAEAASKSPNVDRLYIKDPAGLLTVERARTLIPAITSRINGMPLEIHSHCTIGLSQLSYLTAAELGVSVMQVAAGPLANGSSLPAAERTVANLRELGHTVNVDDRLLSAVSEYFWRHARAAGLPAGTPQEFDASFMRHQIAGGVMSTTRRQMAEIGQEHRFAEVIHESDQVRAELGYPIMVTPFPQMVCSQAMYNILADKRYDNVSDQVIRYVLGLFGKPIRPVDPNVLDRILDRPRAREIMNEPPPPSVEELRKRFKPGISDEEFLLRAVMPAEQVDQMIANGPSRRHYTPEIQPVMSLLREMESRKDVKDFVVEKPGMRLALKRN